MFSIPHLVVIFIVVLVVFGPHKLPELARGLGKLMAEFRKASTDFKMAFEEEMRNIERQAREAEWKKQQEAAAATVQPATLATPADAETPKALPESVEPSGPTVTPVSEAVAHGSEPATYAEGDSAHATSGTTTDENPPATPAHDQQQPA